MSFDLHSIFVSIAILIAVFLVLLAITGRKNLLSTFKLKASPSLQFSQTASGFPPPLIDRPDIDFDDNTTITIERRLPEEPTFEIVEDEESALLKAAEVVVEKVQDVIANTTPNPITEELTSKIKAIVQPYVIFHDTEYFDAINSFIAISVERDCNIKLSKEELLALWN